MRIIKLSNDDRDFNEDKDVANYFEIKLLNRNKGKFYLTKGKIAKKDGLFIREPIVFSYKKKIVYVARADSVVKPNEEPQPDKYPYYFDINLDSIVRGKGTLASLEKELFDKGLYTNKIDGSQGWNKIRHKLRNHEIETVWDKYKMNS